MVTSIGTTTWRGESALRLRAGELSAVFLPGHGLTGVSLRYAGGEHLSVPGGLDTLRRGGTAGLPLLAPWANRLSAPGYRAAGVDVDLAPALAKGRLHTDGNGLPIHGLLAGTSVWAVDGWAADGDAARLWASIDVDDPTFPFPHRIEVTIEARDDGATGMLTVDTTVVATGDRPVPVSIGWHPYLRVPGTPRSRWTLELPARAHLALDERGIPTASTERERAESAPIGARTFDDLYEPDEPQSVLAFAGEDGRRIELRRIAGYPHAQVWVPRGRTFAALEPMSGPTDALVAGTAPLVEPGEAFTASFCLALTGPA